MLASFSAKAISAKAMAMYGKRITKEQYSELLNKKSVGDIAAFLRDETSYGAALAGLQPQVIRRGQLEFLLRKERFERYLRLLHYAGGGKESYYGHPLIEMEIELILKMIELLNAGHPETFIQEYPAFLDGRVSLSLLDLARVRSFDGLLDVLQGTPYAALLQQHRPLGNATSDYAACEATLMTYYFARIEALVRQNFHGKTKQQLLDILQTNLELTNICMIYRMKKYFPQANAPEIQKHLLPLWNRIPQKHLEQLLAAQGVAEFLEKLASSPYAVQTGSDDFVFIEYTGNCVRCKMSRRYLRFATDAPTAFTAYMALQRTELYNLITILEGVRYEMEPPEIQKMLLL